MIKRVVHLTYKLARRIVVTVVGVTIVLLGAIMLVTPGPALIVIPIGLAILSIEFAWARLWLKKLRESFSNRNSSTRNSRIEGHRNRSLR